MTTEILTRSFILVACLVIFCFSKNPSDLVRDNVCYYPPVPPKTLNNQSDEAKIRKGCPKCYTEKCDGVTISFKNQKIDGDKILIVDWSQTQPSEYGNVTFKGQTKYVVGETNGEEGLFVYENKMDCKGFICELFEQKFNQTMDASVIGVYDVHSIIGGLWGRTFSIGKDNAIYYALNDVASQKMRELAIKTILEDNIVTINAFKSISFFNVTNYAIIFGGGIIESQESSPADNKLPKCEDGDLAKKLAAEKRNECILLPKGSEQRNQCIEQYKILQKQALGDCSKPISKSNNYIEGEDGNRYRTVKIGKQEWMAENYKDKNGWFLWCCENCTVKNCEKYGKIYTQAMSENICPSGWHLPSENDFKTLINTVGGFQKAGRTLKSKTTWEKGKNGTDDYGFSAIAAGFWESESEWNEVGLGNYTCFWSSTKKGGDNWIGLWLDEQARLSEIYASDGCYIRCVKNN